MPDLKELLKKKILLLDGAMGTSIQAFDLQAEDFGGEKYNGCNEYLVITRPDVIKSIHEGYLEAGSDIIETNTFAGSSITLAEFDLEDKDYEINKKAAELAKEAANKYSTDEKPRFVAGAIGPTNKTISVTSNITFEELEESYYKQAKALMDGNVDILMIETVFDTLNAKAAFSAIDKLFKDARKKLPLLLSATIERNGTMLAGQDIESFYVSMEHHDLLGVGMNCALGPDLIKDHLRTLSKIAKTNVLCYPNAGLPLEDGTFPLKPKQFAKFVKEFIGNKWVNIVGGCCGTTKEHIVELNKIINHEKRRPILNISRTACSGMETLVVNDDNRPVIVGERTNVIGSKKFKDLICKESFDIATEIGRAQVQKGAQILDICLANPDREENDDTKKFFDIITKKVRVPLMIDSTDAKVIETALRRTQGKCIINSINFEDGTERAEQVMPLIKKYGASIIFGTIDEDKEQAMATTVEKKLQIAKRAFKYLTDEWNFPPQDIIFDALVFPVGTGDKKYADSAKVTIESIKKIKEALPKARTILGVSNVSFGLPQSGREVLNSVYLYHATKAGLDFAIVNSEKLMRYPSISDKEKELAENLLYQKVSDPITPFVEFYRGKKVLVKDTKKLPLAERLPLYILEGRKEGLIEDLEESLKKQKPLEIINGPLMKGMAEVGKLFNENKLIVSEVLQSAESMKAAVSHLEKFMDKSAESKKGKVIIATVKGDVHDIGKNLFDIILSNNGYEVINLGIKIPPDKLIEAYNKHKPDIIGLSGLLVKSAQMMVVTVDDFKSAGLEVPVLVGGAALSSKFTATKISPAYGNVVAYCKDAMRGLDTVKEIMEDPEGFAEKNRQTQDSLLMEKTEKKKEEITEETTERSASIEIANPRKAPDLDEHVIEVYDLNEIFDMINPQMLFCSHLGLKGLYTRLIEQKDKKAVELTVKVNETKEWIIKNKFFHPKAIYRFFECNSEGNTLQIYNQGKLIEKLPFPRQKEGEKLCASDFVIPKEKGFDSMGIFVTTCGQGVNEIAKELREKGEYLKSHIVQILAIESAEALAEITHKKMREAWNIQDKDITKQQIFQAKYHGIRLSYGYPACPDLNEQQKIWKLLGPKKIGVDLTEGMMMEPEASVSALVFHHPQGKYFNV
jgi:5-methyltetrahydrofolate--homocysteine methyltransferase